MQRGRFSEYNGNNKNGIQKICPATCSGMARPKTLCSSGFSGGKNLNCFRVQEPEVTCQQANRRTFGSVGADTTPLAHIRPRQGPGGQRGGLRPPVSHCTAAKVQQCRLNSFALYIQYIYIFLMTLKKTIRLQESFPCCDRFKCSGTFFKTQRKTFPVAPPSSG